MRFAALRAGLRRWFMDAIESVICIAELTVKMFLRELPDAAWVVRFILGVLPLPLAPVRKLRVVRGRSG
jgi:hypothetical protein